MPITLSSRVQAIKPSPTLAVTTRAAQLRAEGQDIIGLGAGEPDFDTPQYIKDAAAKAMAAGQTKYTPVDGTAALKQAIINKYRSENKLDYEAGQILVSCGGKQSFFNLALALLNPGDEVIIPAPYWVSYPDMVLIAEGVPVIIKTGTENRLKMTAQQLESAITPRSRFVVINSPSNPTGMHYSPDELQAFAEVLRRHPHVAVVSDDMYEHIRWDRHKSPFANIVNVAPDLKERSFVLNGVSKAFSMTGWRIGYAAGPATAIAAMKKIQSQSTSNPASISQAAAVAALQGGHDFIDRMVAEFKTRHDFVVEALNRCPGVSCQANDGTFYAFPDFGEAIARQSECNDDVSFAEMLLRKAGVALVPGSAFGAPGFMRISYATAFSQLETAMQRLHQALR